VRAAIVELLLSGGLPAKGFIRQEDARLADFLETSAGRRLLRGACEAETPAVAEMFDCRQRAA
jgi:hypothetical protein